MRQVDELSEEALECVVSMTTMVNSEVTLQDVYRANFTQIVE